MYVHALHIVYVKIYSFLSEKVHTRTCVLYFKDLINLELYNIPQYYIVEIPKYY